MTPEDGIMTMALQTAPTRQVNSTIGVRHAEILHWRTVPVSRPIGEKNRLLAALPPDEYQRLVPHLEVVNVAAKQVLASPEQPIRHIYFPRDGVVALLVPMENGSAAEGATVGNEGMLGLQVFLGDGAASEEIVQVVPGEAARLRAGVFKEVVHRSPAFQTILHRYTLGLMNQFVRTAGCNRIHPVDQRCARLLLMSSDRVGGHTFPVTHEFLATMLAVRRASVTEAAGMLQAAGLIEYRRGQMTISDRAGLEAVACEDYRLTRDGYDRLYGHHPRFAA
jgi:CRP-like cAMP-binding protein